MNLNRFVSTAGWTYLGSIKGYFGLLHRNMMTEAARFSHGQGMTQMQDLSKLDVNNFDGVIFPGGQGIIKNLWGTVKSMFDDVIK